MRISHLFIIQVHYQLPWFITDLYVINIVKINQTSVYFIFKDGSVFTLYVRIFVVNVFQIRTYLYRRIILLLLSKFIYDHVLWKYDITLFACECYCALRREDCCCIVLLTTLLPLDAVRLSTRWLTAPIIAVGLLQPFRSSAQMHDDHFTCIYRVFFLFRLSFYVVFTTACTCQKWQIKSCSKVGPSPPDVCTVLWSHYVSKKYIYFSWQ